MSHRLDGKTATNHVLEHLGVRVDRAQCLATIAGQELDLTPTEFRILVCLLTEPGRVCSRHDLMSAAIAGGAIVVERTIDVHICALRRKLRAPRLIETVRRTGYRFRESVG